MDFIYKLHFKFFYSTHKSAKHFWGNVARWGRWEPTVTSLQLMNWDYSLASRSLNTTFQAAYSKQEHAPFSPAMDINWINCNLFLYNFSRNKFCPHIRVVKFLFNACQKERYYSLSKKMTGKGVILISGGNSEIGGHIRSNLCYLICVRHLIRSRAVANRICCSKKTYFPILNWNFSNLSWLRQNQTGIFVLLKQCNYYCTNTGTFP